jgi:hypothetical protein
VPEAKSPAKKAAASKTSKWMGAETLFLETIRLLLENFLVIFNFQWSPQKRPRSKFQGPTIWTLKLGTNGRNPLNGSLPAPEFESSELL